MNFKNVIKHLETKTEVYDSMIKEMQSDFTTNKYDLRIEFCKKLLIEYESAINFLKKLQKLKIVKKILNNENENI